jgi:hypothetical protein
LKHLGLLSTEANSVHLHHYKQFQNMVCSYKLSFDVDITAYFGMATVWLPFPKTWPVFLYLVSLQEQLIELEAKKKSVTFWGSYWLLLRIPQIFILGFSPIDNKANLADVNKALSCLCGSFYQ